MLVVVTVCVAVAPTAEIVKGPAVPICAAVVGAEVICQVPESNFVTAAAVVVLLMIPRISFVLVLAPPRKSVLPAVVPLYPVLLVTTTAPVPLAVTIDLSLFRSRLRAQV